ncbi:glycosyltransferase 87 family protein [Actinosynnema sp. CA-248983]
MPGSGSVGLAGAADAAGTAGRAGLADAAGTAGRAGLAEAAGTAGRAGLAEAAGTAGRAGLADAADTAGRAGLADAADTAGRAGLADAADTAGRAGLADAADTAGRAGLADAADTAGRAGLADAAGTADAGGPAGSSGLAGAADSAGSAGRLGLLGRLRPAAGGAGAGGGASEVGRRARVVVGGLAGVVGVVGAWRALRPAVEVGVPSAANLAEERMQDFRDALYFPIKEFLAGGNPYDPAVMFAHWPVRQNFNLYQPYHLLLHMPFALPGYRIGAVAFASASLVLLVALAVMAAGRLRVPWVVGTAVVSALLVTSQVGKAQLYVGQVNPLLAVGVAGALLARNSHPRWAALALALAWLKPQFGLPLAILLCARGSWRVALGVRGSPRRPVWWRWCRWCCGTEFTGSLRWCGGTLSTLLRLRTGPLIRLPHRGWTWPPCCSGSRGGCRRRLNCSRSWWC